MTFCIFLQAGVVGISQCIGYISTGHAGNKSFCCNVVFRNMGNHSQISGRSWTWSFICPRDNGAFSDQTGWSYGTNVTSCITSQFFRRYIDMSTWSGAIASQILRTSAIFRSSKYFFVYATPMICAKFNFTTSCLLIVILYGRSYILVFVSRYSHLTMIGKGCQSYLRALLLTYFHMTREEGCAGLITGRWNMGILQRCDLFWVKWSWTPCTTSYHVNLLRTRTLLQR